MQERPLVFICYADADADLAVRLHTAASEAGLKPWCDKVDLVPGDRWDQAIAAALKRSAVMVVLVTDRWPDLDEPTTSWYGPEEVALAIDQARRIDRRMTIIPTLLDGAGTERLPYGLRRLAHVSATGDDLTPIVEGVRRALSERSRSTPSPTHPALDARLVAVLARIDTLEATGGSLEDISAAIDEKKAIKRSLRSGGHLRQGDLLDDYVLDSTLGRGGFATVWRALDRTQGEHVALKVLHGKWNRDQSKIDRFRRGVRQMARLKHPAVVPVIGPARQDNGWHFFAMKYLPGGDLAQATCRLVDPLSPDQGLRAVLEVAGALAEAHRRGVVHRDVKPQNILLDADGRAYLSDFDLVLADDSTGGTGTGAMGTYLYAAPEQLDRPQDVGPRTDVYGLGMTAVFVLTGRKPRTNAKWQPDAVVEALPAPAALKACLRRAIALEEAGRQLDAGRFAEELRAALAISESEPVPSTSDGDEPAVNAVLVDATGLDGSISAEPPPGNLAAPELLLAELAGSTTDEDDEVAQVRAQIARLGAIRTVDASHLHRRRGDAVWVALSVLVVVVVAATVALLRPSTDDAPQTPASRELDPATIRARLTRIYERAGLDVAEKRAAAEKAAAEKAAAEKAAAEKAAAEKAAAEQAAAEKAAAEKAAAEKAAAEKASAEKAAVARKRSRSRTRRAPAKGETKSERARRLMLEQARVTKEKLERDRKAYESSRRAKKGAAGDEEPTKDTPNAPTPKPPTPKDGDSKPSYLTDDW